MKDSVSMAIAFAMIGFAGFRIYQKYFKKNNGSQSQVKKPKSSFSATSKDDDYEPYSGK
jgi:hypothetical protein